MLELHYHLFYFKTFPLHHLVSCRTFFVCRRSSSFASCSLTIHTRCQMFGLHYHISSTLKPFHPSPRLTDEHSSSPEAAVFFHCLLREAGILTRCQMLGYIISLLLQNLSAPSPCLAEHSSSP
ncbi:hypothetical protein NPIL_244991 [Nephila pilipes]|uniref:Uncharacterized protein n=1 Tax=Nephila pilipes TaxID=299642 RepID=A0A8X6MTJ1_NEPPI|nr:hypothetical protein NPIL_244991 [Nephila pilipes]